MPSAARQTRYAADTEGFVCLVLDVRGQAREKSIQVYSYGWKRVVNLPRSLIRIETPNAKRWLAISVTRWLANKEGLHGKPALRTLHTGFTAQFHEDTRSDREKREDAERSLAQFIVDRENRYRLTSGKRLNNFKADRRNGNIFA